MRRSSIASSSSLSWSSLAWKESGFEFVLLHLDRWVALHKVGPFSVGGSPCSGKYIVFGDMTNKLTNDGIQNATIPLPNPSGLSLMRTATRAHIECPSVGVGRFEVGGSHGSGQCK